MYMRLLFCLFCLVLVNCALDVPKTGWRHGFIANVQLLGGGRVARVWLEHERSVSQQTAGSPPRGKGAVCRPACIHGKLVVFCLLVFCYS